MPYLFLRLQFGAIGNARTQGRLLVEAGLYALVAAVVLGIFLGRRFEYGNGLEGVGRVMW